MSEWIFRESEDGEQLLEKNEIKWIPRKKIEKWVGCLDAVRFAAKVGCRSPWYRSLALREKENETRCGDLTCSWWENISLAFWWEQLNITSTIGLRSSGIGSPHGSIQGLNRCFSVLSRADLVRPQSAIIFINQTYWLRLNGTLPLLDVCFPSSILWHFPIACIEIHMFLVSLLIRWPRTNRMRLQSPHTALLSRSLSPTSARSLYRSCFGISVHEMSLGDKEASCFIAWMCACGWKPYYVSLHNRSCRLCTRWHYPP